MIDTSMSLVFALEPSWQGGGGKLLLARRQMGGHEKMYGMSMGYAYRVNL